MALLRLFCEMLRKIFHLLSRGFWFLFLIPVYSSEVENNVLTDTLYFDAKLLDNPREKAGMLLNKFSYTETDVFAKPSDSMTIALENGYARAPIINAEKYDYDAEQFRVSKVDIVFTRYPYNKRDWLTNYYDLLAWRLKALFELDGLLNDPSIEWGLVLQTSGITAPLAKELYHGIVLYLEPLESHPDPEIPTADIPERTQPTPIENQGFLFSEPRNPEMFRSIYRFEPEPGTEPRRNMEPSKLKCPRWR